MQVFSMKILTNQVFKQLSAGYYRKYRIYPSELLLDGSLKRDTGNGAIQRLPVFTRARVDALLQATRWGETYICFIAPGVMSWIVPMVDGEDVFGGISGGEVLLEDESDDRTAAIDYLVGAGSPRRMAESYINDLPVWPQSRVREAGRYLYEEFYRISGLNPTLLERNRENAQQQRQIAEAIQEQKDNRDYKYPIREEQVLLSLMRVGDRNGARRILNNMLAAMFLYSPRLILIRARAIEMMGFLVRAAIEDNPLQEPLMERHQDCIGRIIGAATFEELCEVLRHALDDFMDAIFEQGYNRSSRRVRAIMQVISERYTTRLTLDEVADEVGLSRFHVARLIKRSTGKTMTQHIRTLRINRARELLETTDSDYIDIAYELGFADQSYFIKQFREMTGITPGRYRSTRQ
jgi:two-component system response regulator YesN